MHLTEIERTIPAEHGSREIPKIVKSFASDFKVRIREYKMSPRCFVIEDNNGELTSGFGKGPYAAIGAFGECIEHFHLLHTGINWKKYATHSKKEDLFNKDIFVRIGSNLMPNGEKIHSLPFKDTKTEKELLLPFALVNGDFPIEDAKTNNAARFFSRYASSSGTAFGFCREDAILHAVLETIERDEISKLFLNLLGIHGDNAPYYQINEYNNMPHEINSIHQQILDSNQAIRASTILRKTEFGAYFAFSKLLHEHHHEGGIIWGAGASLSPHLAIYRSLSECEQMASAKFQSQGDKISEMANKYPSFRAITKFDFSNLKPTQQAIFQNPTNSLSVPQQLNLLFENINKTGRTILLHDHEPTSHNYSVVSCYITDMEKFFGIMFDLPLLPIAHLKKYDSAPQLQE